MSDKLKALNEKIEENYRDLAIWINQAETSEAMRDLRLKNLDNIFAKLTFLKNQISELEKVTH